MLTKRTPGLQVFLAMFTLWHAIYNAVLMWLIVFGLFGVDGDELFVF